MDCFVFESIPNPFPLFLPFHRFGRLSCYIFLLVIFSILLFDPSRFFFYSYFCSSFFPPFLSLFCCIHSYSVLLSFLILCISMVSFGFYFHFIFFRSECVSMGLSFFFLSFFFLFVLFDFSFLLDVYIA